MTDLVPRPRSGARSTGPMLAAGLFLVASLGGCSAASSDATAVSTLPSTVTPTTPVPAATSQSDAEGTVGRAAVVAVIDGDTFDVTIDGQAERVRLIGIDTPERGECLSTEATQALAALLGSGEVDLVDDTTDRDRYGRLLRYAWVADTFVNEAQVARGLAVARRYEPDVAEAERLEAAQSTAEAAAIGRWASDACGPPVTNADGSRPQLRIDHIEFDAPGNDAIELNGEWIRIVNDGSASIDLEDWTIRDSSASHRYHLPPITLAANAAITVYSGCGDDTASELFWCSTGSAIWNNDGDTAFLVDPSGNVVTSESY